MTVNALNTHDQVICIWMKRTKKTPRSLQISPLNQQRKQRTAVLWDSVSVLRV